MNKEKIELIDAIINDLDIKTLIAVYEVVINEDFDYIEHLFPTKEEFEDFIEKWKPNKCSEGEE